ncbi:glycerophosphodiester phosphodiesterase [Bacillus sp. B1-b2]|uniref:glycerophosphodiester phosphodiesterase n=1 Tax=Bacillus sp. B1-b2 TaxID=2653201 RepID=UPI0012624D24|nr:glycerophosphodiester phosphodiesterase [Bacillus sp. B1-b2]KAB7664910.1 glycerophosphodiester phosphodiesterase [Bacillus sp. B1-b2]
MYQTKIYGHRGAKGNYPENTLLSFKQAIQQGVDGIELDVHLTKDGEVVVIHDETLNRTTDGNGYIKDLTLEEIKKYSAGSKFTAFPHFKENWINESVPTLKEVLEILVPYKVELNIELKTYLFPYEGIEEKTLALVKEYGCDRKVVYSSFHLPTLLRMKQLDSSSSIAWLLHDAISHPGEYMDSLKLESLHLYKDLVIEHPDDFKNLQHKVRAWTVNNQEELKQLLDFQVEAIITDYPEVAIALKQERAALVE